MNALSLPAPAKLNLMLRITGRRNDGYHLLQTVFQFVEFGDRVNLQLTDDAKIIRSNGADSVAAEQDLVVKAARLLQATTGTSLGARIHLEKNIPLGAGLGGGSSNAASTLLGLNMMWQCGLDTGQLAQLGLQLGADVPVFVHGQSAFAEGVGEQLTAIDLLQPWYLLITPQVHVSTAEIFAASELTRDCPALKICDLFGAGETDFRQQAWDNVCTPIVVARYPQVAETLQCLQSVTENARMSGTGATVFAAFDSQQEAELALEACRNRGLADDCSVVITRGLNRSTLLDEVNTVLQN